MNKRSLILAMVFSSIFGGVIAIVGFATFYPQKTMVQPTSQPSNEVSLTNYVFDSADFVVPEGLNFVFAAKKREKV